PQHRQPARILPLSPEAISQIHSSKHITDLQGVICSLLENSLDAGANKVDISVDWRRGGCTVADNGTGIPAAEFLENGGLGKMYCTSKQHAGTGTKQTHGKAGTFLAELGSMSLLSITSEQEGGGAESVFTMHNGKVIPRQPTADGQTTMPSFAELHRRHGTIVTVRDLFGNMPVRVKQRAHATESAYDQDKAWQKLKRDVVALLLAWHTPCAVKLRGTNTESRRSHLMSWSSKSVKYDIRDAMPVVFQAGLAPTESRGRWIPLSASTSMATLRGMICLHAAPTRRCQFLAIGITPCSSHEILHAVNKVFESSSFGAVEDSTERDSRNRGKLPNGHVNLDRHPMYVLQLNFVERRKCAPADNAHLSEATIQSLTRLLEAAVQAWLESNHFRPRKTKKRRRNMEQGSPAAAIEELAQDDTTPRLDNNTVWIDPISKQVFQVNSRTGVVLPISESHRATSSCGSAQEQRHRAAIDTAVSSAGRPMSLARRSALASTRPQSAVSDKDKWLPGFLEEWKNPVFAKRKEEPIPTASISGPGLIEQLEEDRRCCAADKYQQAFAGHGAKTGGLGGTKLSKHALSDAEVIGQVDRKFILVRMPARRHNHDDEPTHNQNGAGSTLVLIDQHAASERIILEDLLADMLLTPTADTASDQQTFPGPIIKTSSLVHSTTRAKPLIFEVSTHEYELFSRHLSHFTYWGITYQLPSPTSAHSLEGSPPQSRRQVHHHQHRLVVTHLPTVIAERCSHFPALAIELLRTELWAIEDEPSPTTWLSLLPRMPTKLLHMIQSRACRSAIMFNDILPTAECRDTVTKLGNCIFPFVCAHGRCGVVPV
ncbi:uncharacterized protein SEPMUDRAFT_7923, partial [Sphaerulina musiva SO2202]